MARFGMPAKNVLCHSPVLASYTIKSDPQPSGQLLGTLPDLHGPFSGAESIVYPFLKFPCSMLALPIGSLERPGVEEVGSTSGTFEP